MTRFEDLMITRWGARFMGQQFPCAIGRSGIAEKQGEGDGITPLGTYELAGIAVRTDRWTISSCVPTQWIGLQDVWSDDAKDPDYNHGLTAFNHPFSHEKLRRSDPLYDAFGITTYNWPDAQAGKGSAIFLHVWRKPRHPTEGCVAFDRRVLRYIFENWTDRSRIVIR